jgi:hypothetical protein
MSDALTQLAAQAPAGRPAASEEIAEAIVILATDPREFRPGCCSASRWRQNRRIDKKGRRDAMFARLRKRLCHRGQSTGNPAICRPSRHAEKTQPVALGTEVCSWTMESSPRQRRSAPAQGHTWIFPES